MSDDKYAPSERTADRAVELWKRLLRSPKYDNMGDTGTPEERHRQEFASLMTETLPRNNTEEVLDKFGVALKALLLDESRTAYERSCLGVDYGPDKILSEAAETAGLKMEFPWKTVMHVHGDYVTCSAGYGGEHMHHYPLEGGGWLVTSLSGREISKVIEYVQGGTPEFTVEESDQ